MDLRSSDHKPVICVMDFKIRTLIEDKRNNSYNQVLNLLKQNQNNNLKPIISIDNNILYVNNCTYREEINLNFKLKNISNTNAAWRFIKKPEGLICKSYITINPLFGMLLPNEEKNINIKIFVGATSSKELLESSRSLDDILNLRVENGGDDYFVEIKGQLSPTCFGANLNDLVISPLPIGLYNNNINSNNIKLNEIINKYNLNTLDIEKINKRQSPLLIPKELWYLFDYLINNNGLQTYHLFLLPGDKEEMRIIRYCLDYGLQIPNDKCTNISIAATILELLDALVYPVIPTELFPSKHSINDFDSIYKKIKSSNPDYQDINEFNMWSKKFMNTLPNLNFNVLIYVISFLRDLLIPTNVSKNFLQASMLSIPFAKILFRPSLVAELQKQKSSETSSVASGVASWLIGDSSNTNKIESSSLKTSILVTNHLLTIEQKYLI